MESTVLKDKRVNIRAMTIDDYDGLYTVWMTLKGFSMRTVDDSREGIAKFLERNPSLSVVAVVEDEIIGGILCGHDGRRGCMYHVCVREDYRRLGVGKAMVIASLSALEEENISKVSLIAFTRNDVGNSFWKRMGWTKREDLNYYDIMLDEKNVAVIN